MTALSLGSRFEMALSHLGGELGHGDFTLGQQWPNCRKRLRPNCQMSAQGSKTELSPLALHVRSTLQEQTSSGPACPFRAKNGSDLFDESVCPASNVAGNSKPSVFAVFKLINNSNFVC
jgi:hypothetical protein